MKKTSWNDQWFFWEMRDSFALLWNIPADVQKVRLPHDAMLSHKAYAESALGGNSGYRDGGRFCYAKTIPAETPLPERAVLLFDGVYENAAVYVNGSLVTRHPYGYTPFTVELSSHLEAGKPNEIRVMTNNKAANARWYTGGGICRDVWLLTANHNVSISPNGIQVKTEAIDPANGRATLLLQAKVDNASASDAEIRLQFSIGDNCSVCSDPVHIGAHGHAEVSVRAELDHASLWNAETPVLYTCTATLLLTEGGQVVSADTASARFGVRTIALDPTLGFLVNNTPVKLRGACIHSDNGPLGGAEFRDALVRKIRILREAGFNAVRISHHPASTAVLDACDELGMYVMNESFDMWTRNKTDYDYANYFEDWWERDTEAMVRSSYNHPCVVMYSLGNEIPEIGIPKGLEVCRALHEKVRQLDDTRFTTVAVNGVFSVGDIIPDIMRDVLGQSGSDAASGNVNEFLTIMDQNVDKIVTHDRISQRLAKVDEIVDISGYNYMIARYEQDVSAYPERIIVGSETYPPQIGRIWPLVQQHTQIIGDFTWTGWDYIGEAGIGVPAYQPREGGFGALFPCQLAYVGDIDITGHRRIASYYREIVYGLRKAPCIAVQDPARYHEKPILTPWVLTTGTAKWHFPGMEGQPVRIEVYSPGDTVELFQNGRSLGKQAVGLDGNRMAVYETLYEKGSLKAVAYKSGVPMGEDHLETPAEQPLLCARVTDALPELIYVEISCRDDRGILYPTSDMRIEVTVSGASQFWLGTGNPKPDTNYTEPATTLYNGRAILIVRREPGQSDAAVTVRSGAQTLSLNL